MQHDDFDTTASIISAASGDLRAGRIGRRDFLRKLAVVGYSMAAASALATDVLAAEGPAPGRPVPGRQAEVPVPGRPEPRIIWAPDRPAERAGPSRSVPAQVEIQFPASLKLTKSEREQLAREFSNSIALAIRRMPGGPAARSYEVVAKEKESVITQEVK